MSSSSSSALVPLSRRPLRRPRDIPAPPPLLDDKRDPDPDPDPASAGPAFPSPSLSRSRSRAVRAPPRKPRQRHRLKDDGADANSKEKVMASPFVAAATDLTYVERRMRDLDVAAGDADKSGFTPF